MNCAPTLMAQASNRANSVGLTNICGSTTSWPFEIRLDHRERRGPDERAGLSEVALPSTARTDLTRPWSYAVASSSDQCRVEQRHERTP